MEIQNGEYIRTTDGIKKIIKVNEGSNATYYGKYIVEPKYKGSNSINAKNIIKHSFNIIDLIEEGDYVNGVRVNKIERLINEVVKENYIQINGNWDLYSSNINSVLTKEQFKAMEYEVK